MKSHSPNPLVVRPVEVRGGTVWLCPTCEANLQVYRHLLAHQPEWKVRREFGNLIRALAEGS